MTQRESAGRDVGYLAQAERVVSLPEDGGTNLKVARSLIQRAVDQLLV